MKKFVCPFCRLKRTNNSCNRCRIVCCKMCRDQLKQCNLCIEIRELEETIRYNTDKIERIEDMLESVQRNLNY